MFCILTLTVFLSSLAEQNAEKEGSRIAAAATSAADLRSLFPKADKGENT